MSAAVNPSQAFPPPSCFLWILSQAFLYSRLCSTSVAGPHPTDNFGLCSTSRGPITVHVRLQEFSSRTHRRKTDEHCLVRWREDGDQRIVMGPTAGRCRLCRTARLNDREKKREKEGEKKRVELIAFCMRPVPGFFLAEILRWWWCKRG